MLINRTYIFSCLASAFIGAGITNYFLQNNDDVARVTTMQPHSHEQTKTNTQLHTQAMPATAALADCIPTDNAAKKIQEITNIKTEKNSSELSQQPNNGNDDSNEKTSKEFAEWMNKKIQASNNFNLRDTMQEKFNSETIDSVWAEKKENEFIQLFSQQQKLAGYALTATQCRSTQCELTISITDTNQANQLLADIADTLQTQNQFPFMVAAPDQQQGNTKIYITKAASSFEFD